MAVTAAIGAVVAAAGTVVTAAGQAKTAKAQKKRSQLESRQQRIEQARQARIERARIQQAGIGSGAGLESSSVVAGASNVATQARSNTAFIDQIEGLNQRIASGQSTAAIGQGISSLGGAALSIGASRANSEG